MTCWSGLGGLKERRGGVTGGWSEGASGCAASWTGAHGAACAGRGGREGGEGARTVGAGRGMVLYEAKRRPGPGGRGEANRGGEIKNRELAGSYFA